MFSQASVSYSVHRGWVSLIPGPFLGLSMPGPKSLGRYVQAGRYVHGGAYVQGERANGGYVYPSPLDVGPGIPAHQY